MSCLKAPNFPSPICQRPPFPSGWSHLDLTLDDLNLSNTLPVGDALDTQQGIDSITEEYSRALQSPPRVILLRQSPAENRIYFSSVQPDLSDPRGRKTEDLAWLLDYFQLERVPELPALYAQWIGRDEQLFARTIGEEEVDRLLGKHRNQSHGVITNRKGQGIRLLNQDPWECLIAFITSTNNHIPRISGLMHRLSQIFSPPLLSLPTPLASSTPITPPPEIITIGAEPDPAEGSDSALHDTTPQTIYHLFPSSASLANPDREAELESILRTLGFGYRAGFIASSLKTLRDRFGAEPGDIERGLMALRHTGDGADQYIEEVRTVLLELKGVGRKVADCVMLMCLGQDSLIPIDTHVAAIAARHPAFPSRLKNKPMSPALYDEVQAFLAEKWGPMGGWAQAVMFALDLPDSTVSKGARDGSVTGTPKKGTGSNAGTPTKKRSIAPVKAESGVSFTANDVLSAKQTDSNETAEARDSKVEDALNDSPSVKRKAAGTTSVKTAAIPPTFKRTRSSARLELQRQSSGISAIADQVDDLDV